MVGEISSRMAELQSAPMGGEIGGIAREATEENARSWSAMWPLIAQDTACGRLRSDPSSFLNESATDEATSRRLPLSG